MPPGAAAVLRQMTFLRTIRSLLTLLGNVFLVPFLH